MGDNPTYFHLSHRWDLMHFYINEMQNHLKSSEHLRQMEQNTIFKPEPNEQSLFGKHLNFFLSSTIFVGLDITQTRA